MDPILKEILKHQGEIREKKNEGRIEKYKEKYSKLGQYLGKDPEFDPHSGYMKLFFEKGYMEIGAVPPENPDLPDHREVLFVFYNEDEEN